MSIEKLANNTGWCRVWCRYCGPNTPLIEHWDKLCLQHISEYVRYSNAPTEACQEAKIMLMTSIGVAVMGGEDGSIVPSTEGTSKLLTTKTGKKRKLSNSMWTKEQEDIHIHRNGQSGSTAWSVAALMESSLF